MRQILEREAAQRPLQASRERHHLEGLAHLGWQQEPAGLSRAPRPREVIRIGKQEFLDATADQEARLRRKSGEIKPRRRTRLRHPREVCLLYTSRCV